jgi:hypothetical protein
MEDGIKGLQDSAQNPAAKLAWTAPVLIACGSMMNVLADSGFGGDATATGSQTS